MRRRPVLVLAAIAACCAFTSVTATAGQATAGETQPGSVTAHRASAVHQVSTAEQVSAAEQAAAVPAWDAARQLPGLSGLAKGPVEPDALSCSSARNCALGGSYTDGSHGTQAFVAGETRGRWGPAVPVPGLAALNKGGSAAVTSVSCAAPGDCTAGGRYSPGGTAAGTRSPGAAAFVVSEFDGVWGSAIPLRGLPALNKGNAAQVSALSCWTPGDCATAGTYAASVSGREVRTEPFVAGETNGVWGPAVPLPGLAALNVTGLASVSGLSCTSAAGRSAGGYCAVAGQYGARRGTEPFVAVRTGGKWRPAREYPGVAALNTAGAAGITSVSCPAAGGCAVAGSYARKAGNGTETGAAFVADQRAGGWGRPHVLRGAVPGAVVSCGSPGNCAAGGVATVHGASDAFVATESRGQWGNPRPVPGLDGLDAGHDASVVAVSCPSAGDCGAGGSYADTKSAASDQAFVVAASGGNWSRARRVPGLAAPGSDDASVTLMSCTAPLSCTAAGYDDNGEGVFIASTTR